MSSTPTEPEPRAAPARGPLEPDPRELRGALRLLHSAVFLASFDRLAIAPLLIPIALDLDVPVEQVAVVATLYFVGYGITQVLWGFASDRLGRVRTVRIALGMSVVAGVVGVLAPTVVVLAVARFVAGAAYAAVFPTAIIYIGDSLPAHRRHGPLADLMAVSAVGMATATLVAAGIADLSGWRAAFAAPTVVAAVLVVLLRRVPEPRVDVPRQRPAASLAAVLLRPWPVAVLLLVLVEGMVLVGILTYLPALLQRSGMSATGSGLVTAGYGVAVLLAAPLVKRLARAGMSAGLRLITGGVLATASYAALLLDQAWVGVLSACVLLAGAWAFMHTTLQTWITEVAPGARATAVSLFASGLFLGGAAWTALGAAPFASGRFTTYLVAGAALSAALGVAATWLHRSYRADPARSGTGT
ncbi:MFS transporter [Actinotalea sp. Marseille-Q4924]|uniref:MFS transporter n=1 Tax=Actinotalea sp. Marseille-Q4924 TaxID=2866571 RepID=UPI001CE4AEF5|nr:MFS transporter [Actinotalea sp. Marseille-Q4924]